MRPVTDLQQALHQLAIGLDRMAARFYSKFLADMIVANLNSNTEKSMYTLPSHLHQ